MSEEKWRVGTKVPINVYEGDRPICQCHTALDAKRIVEAVNGAAQPTDLELQKAGRVALAVIAMVLHEKELSVTVLDKLHAVRNRLLAALAWPEGEDPVC